MSLWLAWRTLAKFSDLLPDTSVIATQWVHPDSDLPFIRLKKLSMGGSPQHLLPLLRQVTGMIEEGAPYEAEVNLLDVRAMTHTDARFLANLDALPETMRLLEGETFGPLNDTEMVRLRTAIEREFGVVRSPEGHFGLYLQSWDGMIIACNSGAAHRFALWRRLARWGNSDQTIPARITPLLLSSQITALLRTHRVLVINQAENAVNILYKLQETWHQLACAPLFGNQHLLILPKPETVPVLAALLGRIHSKLEGCFDLGHYLNGRRGTWEPQIRSQEQSAGSFLS